MGEPAGLIFDLDGTLVDTMAIGRAALNATVAAFGLTPAAEAMAPNGTAFAERLRIMRANGDLDAVTDADLYAEYERQVLARVADARPITPVVDILWRAHGTVPLALATGSIASVVTAVLAAVGLSAAFDAIVTRDDVEHGKPAPDTFLRAAELLGVEPGECLVYEDSPVGFAAARAAGMRAIDVRSLVAPR